MRLPALVTHSGFLESHGFAFFWQGGRLDLTSSLVVVREENRKTVKRSRCFPLQENQQGAVRLQPPGGQLVPGDPGSSHEKGASCGIAPCNNRLYITGGRDEKNRVIATVLCWDPEAETDGGMRPAPGVSHHGSVTIRKSYTHIQDRAWSCVGLIPGAPRAESRGEPASSSPAPRSCFGHQRGWTGGSPRRPLESSSEVTALGHATSRRCLRDLPQEEKST